MRIFLVALVLPLASCTKPQHPPVEFRPSKELQESLRLRNCGYSGVLGQTAANKAVVLSSFNGKTVRACALPNDTEISEACALKDAKALETTGGDSRQKFGFPPRQVRNAVCSYSDSSESLANCRFEISEGDRLSAWRAHESKMSYRFRDLSDDIAHDWYITSWEADTSCLPSDISTQVSSLVE
jgi:hypothetical protein